MTIADAKAAWAPPEALRELGRRAAIVGGVALVPAAIGGWMDPGQLLRSWLVAVLLYLGIALGSLALLMLQHVTGGTWGFVIRRQLEAAARTLPFLLVLFLAVLISPARLYEWARPEVVAHDALLQHKAPYLNRTGFTARTIGYFVLWMAFAYGLDRLSRRQDDRAAPKLGKRMRRISAPGLGLYGAAATFAAVDWLMSLDPRYASSMYGIYFIGSQGLSALAFAILVATWLRARKPMDQALRPEHFHDIGKLLLAFVMLWSYFCISQYLIVWSGNIPEEVRWYLVRTSGGWGWVGLMLVLFHFAVPFLLLLSRDLKRDPRRLAPVAMLVLVMRWVDLYWQAAPAWSSALSIHWLDPVMAVALGALWFAEFVRQIRKRPMLPVGDPAMEELLAHD
ncbi:MAG: hypothetical protein U0166_28210 [Acidobacteriota bacterium]